MTQALVMVSRCEVNLLQRKSHLRSPRASWAPSKENMPVISWDESSIFFLSLITVWMNCRACETQKKTSLEQPCTRFQHLEVAAQEVTPAKGMNHRLYNHHFLTQTIARSFGRSSKVSTAWVLSPGIGKRTIALPLIRCSHMWDWNNINTDL